MDDRELLNLAAKAAEIAVWFGPDGPMLLQRGVATWPWNPLTSDRDALRLAVTLGLVVDCSRPSAGPPFYSHLHAEIAMEDRHAATRRAIVRAAAEIARKA